MHRNIAFPESRITDEQSEAAATSKIHVGIIAGHSLAAQQLLQLIKANHDMLPVVLADGVKTEPGFPLHARVVIVIDLWGLALPSSEYLDTFAATIPGCGFLALDRARDEAEVARLLRAGFHGFITHHDALTLLSSAIIAVFNGMLWSSPEAAGIYVKLTSRTASRGTSGEMLTCRENEVLELLRRRYSNRELASVLRISESTVKFHVSNVLMKLNVSSRRALTDSGLLHAPRFVMPKIAANGSRGKHERYRCG
jgi:DNA-binding NarL/FixJ family response regulator